MASSITFRPVSSSRIHAVPPRSFRARGMATLTRRCQSAVASVFLLPAILLFQAGRGKMDVGCCRLCLVPKNSPNKKLCKSELSQPRRMELMESQQSPRTSV